MARPIVVRYQGHESRFDFEKLERSRLYGRRRRVPMDPQGRPCTRASLTGDGRLLIVSGMTAQGYFDAGGRWIPTSDLVGLDADGRPLPLKPSTLGEAQELRGPVSPQEVLDLPVTAVYLLNPQDLHPTLQEALAKGHIFGLPFNWRADFREEQAFLLQNDQGLFALVGQPAAPAWLAHEAPPVVAEDADEEGDLDFEMF